MTGGGFGGCTVTLLKKSSVPALLKAIAAEYPKRTGGKQASCFATQPAVGAMVLQNGEGAVPEACGALQTRPRRMLQFGSGFGAGVIATLAATFLLRLRH
mmetsp:Transcript_33417/g.73323  ORF Transcript_33417/g.73323 Transcript_33417/m.73323 type:complete len:100 (+) Transcript_33417:1-300(+)